MKGIVKSIFPNAQQKEYEYNGQLYKKYSVTFLNGKQYNFSTKANFNNGELTFKVGETIDYEITNEKMLSAKTTYVPKTDTAPKTPRTQQQEIQLSVCFNGAVRLASKGKIQLDEVPLFTKDFFNQIFN